jgi:dTDP-4-amino-4,6-dideoxygalactose transaminase
MTPTKQRKIPLLDLTAIHAPLRDRLIAEITQVVDSQRFIMGSEVKDLEEAIAKYSHTKYAIGCASGSDALVLALMAAGIGPGDQVLTTPYTFFATAGAVSRVGATPVFVDIDPATYNIDPVQVREKLAENPAIKAVIPVHLFGGCADMDPIMEAARAAKCVVIEDGAQSIGAEYKGRKAQSIGDMGCLSFFPSKNLGGFGDGGMVTTNDENLAKRLGGLRTHGSIKKYYHDWIGMNSRLDTLQAAVLKVKLPELDGWSASRQKNADLYRSMLGGANSKVTLPATAPYQTNHVYNQFVIRSVRRDALKAYLQENGIGTEVYYPLPLHLQPCYKSLGYKEGDLPESERAAKESLALPIHPAMSREDIEYVCEVILDFAKTAEGAA